MKIDEAMGVLRSAADRYDVFLDSTHWSHKVVFGGIGMEYESLASLFAKEGALGYGAVTVYEMETMHKKFPPFEMPLSAEGFRSLKGKLMAHFDLMVVPHSCQWALVLTNDLESIFFGPTDLLHSIPGN